MVTDDFEKKLKAHIEKLEDQSPIEIVPVHVKRASGYTAWSLVYGLALSYLPSQMIGIYFPFWGGGVILLDFVVWLLLGLFLGMILRSLNFFSLLIPSDFKRQRVEEMANSLFLREGVHETKDRLGILIAVFDFEKSSVILADKGFNEHIKPEYWSELGALLAKDFNRNKAGDEFLQALHDIEKKIAPHFKHSGENKNEISDDLRKR